MVAGKTAKSILISCGTRLAPFDIAELREVTEQLADTFKKSLEHKVKSLKEISEANIIDIPREDYE